MVAFNTFGSAFLSDLWLCNLRGHKYRKYRIYSNDWYLSTLYLNSFGIKVRQNDNGELFHREGVNMEVIKQMEDLPRLN